MAYRFFCLGFLILLGVSLGAQSALAETRVALVIGNGAYTNEPHLPNPPNDASDVAAALRQDGFETILAIDLDKAAMDAATIKFARAARDADVAMFYYSGHALQYAGVNYLAPIDFQLSDEADLRRMVRLDDIVSDLQQAKKLRILVLDSCRDNPLAEQLRRSVGAKRSLQFGRGLAKLDSPQGMIVAYSTQAGTTADDGQGRNSPYTAAFLKNIEAQEEIGTIFRRISSDVYEMTKHEQLPELSLSLIGEFYLRGKVQLNIKPDAPDTTQEDFAAAERVDTVGGWDAFLAQHPTGYYATLAKERQKKVTSTTPAQSGGTDTKPPAEPKIAALPNADSAPSDGGVTNSPIDVAAVRRKYSAWTLHPKDIHAFRAIATSPDGSIIAAASDDGSIKIWDTATGSLLRVLVGHTGPVNGLVFLPDGHKLLAGSNDKNVDMWDGTDGKLLRAFYGSTHDGAVSSLSSSINGLFALSSIPKERSFTVWDTQTGAAVINQQNFDNPISVAAMGPDGHIIAAAGISGAISIWDQKKFSILHELKGHSARINAVSISRDGRRLVSASDDRSIRVWELPSGKWLRTLMGHADTVRAVAISADGRRIASAGADDAVIVWDLTNGARLQTLSTKSGEVMGVTFSPDGNRVISGTSDGAIKIWNAKNGAWLESYLDLGQETGAVVREDGSFWTNANGLSKLRLFKGTEAIPLPDEYVAAFLRQGSADQKPTAAAR